MFNVTPIKAFSDNYIWLLQQTSKAIAVDPGDAAPLIAYLEAHHLSLDALLITHHHTDHTGGIPALLKYRPGLAVYGPANIMGVNRPVRDDDHFTWNNVSFKALAVPGHTRDHIAYYTDGHLFCGDTLFSIGCGRIFDSNANDFYHSLKRLSILPADTWLYPAHEYTQDNLRFATAIDPTNPALGIRQQQVATERAQNLPTLPVKLVDELAANPFLRTADPVIRHACEQHTGQSLINEQAIFRALRDWKNQFR